MNKDIIPKDLQDCFRVIGIDKFEGETVEGLLRCFNLESSNYENLHLHVRDIAMLKNTKYYKEFGVVYAAICEDDNGDMDLYYTKNNKIYFVRDERMKKMKKKNKYITVEFDGYGGANYKYEYLPYKNLKVYNDNDSLFHLMEILLCHSFFEIEQWASIADRYIELNTKYVVTGAFQLLTEEECEYLINNQIPYYEYDGCMK